MGGLRLPEHLAVLVTDEPLLDVYAQGPWAWPAGLDAELKDRLRAVADDERSRRLMVAKRVGRFESPLPAVVAELNLLVDFLVGEGAICAGTESDLTTRLFDQFRVEPQTGSKGKARKRRGPLDWSVAASLWRPPGEGFLAGAAGDDPELHREAFEVLQLGISALEGVKPWEGRRLALSALLKRMSEDARLFDENRLPYDKERLTLASGKVHPSEFADEETLAVLPELSGPIGYLSWILDGWLAAHEHLRQVASGGEPSTGTVAKLLSAQSYDEVPVELAAATDLDFYEGVEDAFEAQLGLETGGPNTWYNQTLAWLTRCLVAGEADAARQWLDLSMRLSFALKGLPGNPAHVDEPYLPVSGFQRELRRLFLVHKMKHPGLSRVPSQERPLPAHESGAVVEAMEIADRIVGQPELRSALQEIASAPGRPVRLLVAGPPSTGQSLTVRVLERILNGRGFVQEPEWLSATRLQSSNASSAVDSVRSLVKTSADRRLLVLDGLDEIVANKTYGNAVADELHRALDTRGRRLPIVAFTSVNGDKKVFDVKARLAARWQVVHTTDFEHDDYVVLFREAVNCRGAEVDPDTAEAAASLLVSGSQSGDLRNGSLADHLADRAVVAARRRGEGNGSGKDQVMVEVADLPARLHEHGMTAEDDQEDALAELEALPGLDVVKGVVKRIVAESKAAELRKQAGQKVRQPGRHLVFVGNAGTGKTMVARRLGNVFHQLGLLSKGHVVEVTRTDLVGEYRSDTAPKVNAVVEKARGGVLFIDEAYTLAPKVKGDLAQDAVDTLMKLMEDNRDDLVVIAAGHDAPMRDFLSANPGLESRFAAVLTFPDLTDDELIEVFRRRAAAGGITLADGVETRVRDMLRKTARGPSFGNARVMRSLLDRALSAQAQRVLANENPDPAELRTLLVADLPSSLTNRVRLQGDADPLAELDQMVGLQEIKKTVHQLVAEAKAEELRREAGLPIASPTRHLVFTGSPGTAKTTVARLLAGIYADLGLLSSGHLVEVGRSDLVAEYVGQTAPRVTAVVERARGGVLFIDEAYALSGLRGRDDYGAEAIATLLKLMEDNRSDLVVIVAGYEDEMSTFLTSNPGLASRFPRVIRFPDYTGDELVEIFTSMSAAAGFSVDDTLLDRVRHFVGEASRDQTFGNARYVRNLLDRAIAAQAQRITRGPEVPPALEVRTLRREDLDDAMDSDEGNEPRVGQYL